MNKQHPAAVQSMDWESPRRSALLAPVPSRRPSSPPADHPVVRVGSGDTPPTAASVPDVPSLEEEQDSISRVKCRTSEPPTLGSFAERKLTLLCEGLGLGRERDSAVALLRRLSDGWAQFPLGPTPAWSNDITDDSSPFEYSVALRGNETIVRILVEAQEAPIHSRSSWAAGLRLNEELRKVRGFSLSRFELVQDLFEPSGSDPVRFSIWHAAALAGDRDPAFKAYLNPQVHGAASAREVVREALVRLGLDSAWGFLASRFERAGHGAQPLYFSLDLSSSAEARVKIYVTNPGAAGAETDAIVDGCRDHLDRDASRWIRQLVGTSGAIGQRPVLVCFSFDGATLPRATVHVPIRCHADSDEEALQRTCRLLTESQRKTLSGGVRAMACRALASGRGVITYVSIRRVANFLNVTTYLAPEAYDGRITAQP